jgi:hypothetical protein
VPQSSSWQPQTEVNTSTWEPKTERVQVAAHTRKPKSKAAIATSFLPAIGGTAGEIGGGVLGGLAGGVVGAPTGPGELATIPAGVYAGRVLGSTAGASLGRMAENALAPLVGESPQPLLQGVGQEAALQGGLTAVGIPAFSKVAGLGRVSQVTGAGAKLGQGVMELAGRLTPEAAKTAIFHGINATRGGGEKLLSKLNEAGQFTERLYRLATSRGVRYQMADLADRAEKDLIQPMLERGLKPDASEVMDLAKFKEQWLKDHKNLLSPVELKKAIQDADANLTALYKRIGDAKLLKGAQLAEDRFLKGFRDQARAMLDNLPDTGMRKINGQWVRHGVQQAEDFTQDLIKLKNEVYPEIGKKASLVADWLRKGGPSATLGAAGAATGAYAHPENRAAGAAIGGAAGLGLANPYVASQLAYLLNNPALQSVLGNLIARPVASQVVQAQQQ